MHSFKEKNERILTIAVITVSVAGILYFGFRAILADSIRNQDNPFEYDIENLKKTDADLIHYMEVATVYLCQVISRLLGISRESVI